MDKRYLTVVHMTTGPKTPAERIRKKQGEQIRHYRTMYKLSQAELASRLDPPVTKAAVSEWERGVSSPRRHLQVQLAREFSAPWSVLFGLDYEAA